MTAASLNRLQLHAKILELQPLRYTPAGVPVTACILAHESRQTEAEQDRNVSVELQAVALGRLANVLAAAAPGMNVEVTGFLAAKSLRSRMPVLHLNTIEFMQGNQNGDEAQV